MDDFFSNPHLAGLFPKDETSPTLALLLSGHDGGKEPITSMASALRAGWLNTQELSVIKDGIPALGHWMHWFTPSNSKPGHSYHWPVDGVQGWAKVGPKEGPVTSFSAPGKSSELSMRAQWLTGLCISLAPKGLAPVRWTAEADTQPRVSMLSLAVGLGWAGVASQLARVPDAPSAKEMEALRMPKLRRYESMSGPPGRVVGSEEVFPPLLHHALETDEVVARVLMEHGVSPACRDDLGVPAWYRATSAQTLETALSFMPSAQSAFEEPVIPLAYWGRSLSYADTATAHMGVFSKWLRGRATKEQINELALQSAARGMTDCGVSALQSHLKHLGTRPSSTWHDAQKRQWGLATAALAWLGHLPLMQDAQESAVEGAGALAWSLSRGNLGKLPRVWPGVDNADALWFLTARWTRGRNAWGKHEKNPPEITVEKACAWADALVESCRNPDTMPGFIPASVQTRGEALLNAWRGLGHLGSQESQAPEVIRVREAILASAQDLNSWEVSRTLISFSLDWATSCAHAGNPEEASRWLGWGLHLLAAARLEEILPAGWDNDAHSLQVLARKALGNDEPNTQGQSSAFQYLNPVKKIMFQVRDLMALGTVEPSAPLPSLSHWADHPVLCVAEERLRPVFWSAQWPEPAPRRPRGRF